MLTQEQKEDLYFYLVNCKVIYQSSEHRKREAAKISRLKKLLEYCDLGKLHWENLQENRVEGSKQKLTLSAADFIAICDKLFTKGRGIIKERASSGLSCL